MKRTALTRKTPLERQGAALQRKAMKRRKGAAADRRDNETRVDAHGQVWTGTQYLAAVRMQSCVVCFARGCEAHHPIHDRHSSARPSHFDAIPLCPRHHRTGGPGVAIHAGKETWRELHGPDHAHTPGTRWNILGETA